MKRRVILPCLLFVATIGCVVLSAASAEAWPGRRSRSYAPRYRPAAQATAYRSGAQVQASPGLRQVDGKTLWDLGKQMGQWPKLP